MIMIIILKVVKSLPNGMKSKCGREKCKNKVFSALKWPFFIVYIYFRSLCDILVHT